MTNAHPTTRPTAAMALSYFEMLVASQGKASMRWRLQPRYENAIPAMIGNVNSAFSELRHRLKRVICESTFSTAFRIPGY